MIHFKNKTKEGFEFWFTESISQSDFTKLAYNIEKLQGTFHTTVGYELSTRLDKNHYIYYKNLDAIGIDQLDNYGD